MFFKNRKSRKEQKQNKTLVWKYRVTAEDEAAFRAGNMQGVFLNVLVPALSACAAVWIFESWFSHAYDAMQVKVPLSTALWIVLLGLPLSALWDLAEGILRKRIRFRIFGQLVTGIVYVAALRRYYRVHEDDFGIGENGIATIVIRWINSYYHASIEEWGGAYAVQITPTVQFWLICIFLILGICVMVFRRRQLYLIAPGVLLIGSLAVGYAPDFRGLFVFGLAIAFSGSGIWDPKKAYVFRRGKSEAGWMKRMVGPIAAVTLLSIFVGVLGGVVLQRPAEMILENGDLAFRIEEMAEEGIRILREGRLVKDGDNEISNDVPAFYQREMLRVATDFMPRANVYLKGTYGVSYEDGEWNDDREEFERTFEQTGASSRISRLSTELGFQMINRAWEPMRVQISYTGLGGDTGFFPYFLKDAAKHDLKADAMLEKESDETEFEAWTCENWEDELLNCLQGDGNLYQYEEDDYAKFVRRVCSSPYQIQNRSLRDDIKKLEQGAKRFLQGMYEEGDELQERNAERILCAAMVMNYLSEYRYSTTLDDLEGDVDPVEYFLTESHVGYCKHFASAGVLMLQNMGVPARYVSGFLVDRDQFEKAGKRRFEASVEDDCAHAWTEIYLESIGWVPVDMTPGYAAYPVLRAFAASVIPGETLPVQMPEEDKPKEPEDRPDREEDTEEKSTQQDKEENAGEEREDTDSQTASKEDENTALQTKKERGAIKEILPAAAGVLLLAAAVFFLFGIRRRMHKKYLQRTIASGKSRYIVRRLHREIYRMLRRKNRAARGSLNDREMLALLIKTYPQIAEDSWEEYMDIARRARFSGEEITGSEAAYILEIYGLVAGPGKKGSLDNPGGLT